MIRALRPVPPGHDVGSHPPGDDEERRRQAEALEHGRWLWNHEARQRMLTCRMAPAQVETVIERMKKLGLAERQREEERIRAATPAFAPSAAEHHQFDLGGWDELRRLDPRIVTIGSHTLTHPILTNLQTQEMETEITQSRGILEEKLQRPVDLFAYPYGGRDNFLEPYRTLVKAAGFRCCCSGFGGGNPPGTDPFQLRRVPITPWYGSPHRFGFEVALRRAALA